MYHRQDINRLNRCDGALFGGRNPLLQLTHVGAPGGLISDRVGIRLAGRHLGIGLDESEYVVDEEQHVLPSSSRKYSATVTPDRATRAPPRRLIHLAVNQSRLFQNPRLFQVAVEIVAFTASARPRRQHTKTPP